MSYTEIFAREYFGKVFYFCLKKTGNEQDAEELASDIGYEVISSLKKGAKPENFGAWVWAVANNVWAKWAKKKYYSHNASEETEESARDAESEFLLAEDLRLLRRELAFIRSDYREILLEHYFGGKSVSVISRELGIPLGTVMTKLQNGRKILKEGMNMAREFGIRSYSPEEVRFTNSGGMSRNGQPWEALSHLMYKNIFLEVYNNPKTAEELSLELGVALPYMEDDLKYLTKQTFLECNKGKYETNFCIIGREAQRQADAAARESTALLTKLLEERTDYINDVALNHGNAYYGKYQTYEEAKWTLLMYAFKNMFDNVCKYKKCSSPVRPDGGAWEIVGYQTIDFDLPNFVEFNISKRIKNAFFGMFRFKYEGIFGKIPYWLSESEIRALALFVRGHAEVAETEELEKLKKYGYIREKYGKAEPALLIFDEKEKIEFCDKEKRRLEKLDEEIYDLLKSAQEKTLAIMRVEMPRKFFEAPRQYNHVLGCLSINNNYICEQALRDGYLKYDARTSQTIGNFIFI